MSSTICNSIAKTRLDTGSRFLATLSFNHGLSSRPTSVANIKLKESIYRNVKSSLSGSSRLLANENVNFSPKEEFSESAIGKISCYSNANLGANLKLFSFTNFKTGLIDKFVGYKPAFRASEKLYPIQDISFKSKLTDANINLYRIENNVPQLSNIYSCIDEGVFTGDYVDNGKDGSIISDDSSSFAFTFQVFASGDIQYKFRVTKPLSVAKLSYLALRASAPFDSYTFRKPQQYKIYDIRFEDPAGNLIIKYDDIFIRGDTKYSTYISKPVINNLLLPTWNPLYPSMDETGPYTLTLNISFNCDAFPFNNNFDAGYEQTCIINSNLLNPNPLIGLNISALEIGISGGVGILRDNYLNFFSKVRDKSEREKRTLLPTELFSYNFDNGIYPQASSVWKATTNDVDYYNTSSYGSSHLLNRIRNDITSNYITAIYSTPVKDSGRLILKFDTKPDKESYDNYIDGAFTFGGNAGFNSAKLVNYLDNDNFFDIETLELKVIAKKAAGTPDYTIDVVGYSDDKLLNVTPAVGGFLQNSGALVFDTNLVPDISGYAYKTFGISDSSFSDQSEYFKRDISLKGDHYILNSTPIVNSTSFKEYIIPLDIYQNPYEFGYKKYSISSLFENLYLDISPLPSGASICSVKLVVYYKPANAISMYTLGSPAEKNAARTRISLLPSLSGTISNSNLSGGSIVGFSNPANLNTNYSRRWRGHTGDILTSNSFNYSEFDFSFDHKQSNTPFSSYVDFTNTNLTNVYDHKNTLFAQSTSNLNVLSNFGWRYSSDQLIDGITTPYKSISWNSNIYDTFDRALKTNESIGLKSTVLNTSNSFAFLLRYTPDNADSLDLDNHVILSHEDNSNCGLVLTVEDGNLKLKIKNNNNNVNTIVDTKQISDYSFPLCVLITYNAEDYHSFKLYTYDNSLRFVGDSIYNIPKVLSNPSTLFGFSQSYSDQPYIVGPVSIFVHEIGYSNTCNILDNPNRFKNQISVSEFFNSYNVPGDYIDDDISKWKLGAFKVCQFSPDFDFFTKRIGKDFITFNLSHNGSGYYQTTNLTLPNNINLSGVAYHTQIENDFLRFDLSDIPTVDKDKFYALAPRICKTLPRGYKFNKEAICVDSILEYETNNDIVWSNGKVGPKLIVSLYAKTQNDIQRPSKSFGLINRATHYLEPSGCIRKFTSTFSFEDLLDESEPWALFDQESRIKEFEEKYFSKDIDDMFLQYDLVYPSGKPFSSLIKLHSANVRLDDAIFIAGNSNNQFNLLTSGKQYQISNLNLFSPLSSSGSPTLTLFVNGDRFFQSNSINLFANSTGYGLESPYLTMHTVSIGSLDSQEQTFSSMFGASPVKGLTLSISGQLMRETNMPLYVSPMTYRNSGNLLLNIFGPNSNEGQLSDAVNLRIKGISQSINAYPSSNMPLYVYGKEFPTKTQNYAPLFVVSDDFNKVRDSGSLTLHTLNYPISPSLANSSASINWTYNNTGKNITVQDNIYAYIDSDDNIRGVDDLICYGTCSSDNRCSEAVVDIHGVKWYEPEVCVNGGIFRAKSTYTNLTYPSGSFRHTIPSEEMNLVTENYDFIVDENNDYISINIPSSSVFDPMPYSGHFYGIRKYTGLAPSLPYYINITGKSGSTYPIDIPTEIIEVEYNKNEDDEISTDYNGFRLLSSGIKTSGDEFGKSIASKDNILVVGSPKRSITYSDQNTPLTTLQEAGMVFVYRRKDRSNGDWPLDNYKSPWILEASITLPSGMIKDYYVQSTIENFGLPNNLKPIQTNWFVGQEGRQFGHSVDIAINKNEKSLGENSRQILVVGGPSAKWTPRIFDNNPPADVNIGLMIFTDEFTPRIPAPTPGAPFRTIGYEDVLAAIKDKDIVFNYFGKPRIRFNVKLIICQPIADSPDITPPSFPDKPDFMVLNSISRNYGYKPNSAKTDAMVSGMKSAFFEAFPRDTWKIHNNIPPMLGLYVDNSNSLGRQSLEPAIDKFIDFYKNYSFLSGVKVHDVQESGQVIEYIPEDYSAENWVEMSKLILSEVLDTGRLIQNNQVRFLTDSIGEFDTSLGAFNIPPDSGGKAYIFEKESGSWNLIQEIKSPNLTYSNPDRFGHAVSISDDGELVAIGSPYINQAITMYERKEEERERFYSLLGEWVRNNHGDKYAAALSVYDQSYNQKESAKSLYLALTQEHKFKSRVDLGIEEYQNIYTFDYSSVQPIGSWSFIPNAVAPTSRLGYSIDVNEDGSVVVASAPTDSLNLYNDGDIYYNYDNTYRGKRYSVGYNDPYGIVPNNVKSSWSSSVNAGSIHVFESRKYYPHNQVIEYGRFGNLHEIDSDYTPDSGHFHYLADIFEDKNFVKTGFTDNNIPKEAGLAFIITPAVDALSISDEVYNNIYNWLALGDRNLVLVANDPLWEENGKYRNSNEILNKLLERLHSRMRIVPARSKYESLPAGYSTFNNVIPSFVPQGSTSTYVSRSSVRGSGVADIRIYYPGYNEVMPCKEVEDCSPDPAKIQIQSRCEMPLIHYGDLRAQWNASCCTNGGMLIYGYNWPFVFGSYKPLCGDTSFEDNPKANFEPIPLLAAAEKVTYDVHYPAIPAQYKNFPIYETVYTSTPYYAFGGPITNVPASGFIWDSGNVPSGLILNASSSISEGKFYQPHDGLLQAKGTSKINITPYISKELVSDKSYYCIEHPYSNTTSKIIILAGVETESPSALLTGQGDQNIKFYANLVSKTPTVNGESDIAQLGGWTGRTSFTDGYANSYLKTLFTGNRNEVEEDVDTSFTSSDRKILSNAFNVAWVANIISQPSSLELNDIKTWLSNGNKKLIITCSDSLDSIKNAQQLCHKLGVVVEPVFLNYLDRYPKMNTGLEINPSHQAGGQFNNNKIEYFTAGTSFYPLKLTSGGIGIAYDNQPIYDEVPKTNSDIVWDINAGITKVSIPVTAGSGYKLFITTSSDTPSEIAHINVDVENATYLPNLPYPVDFSSSQLNELDNNGEIVTYKTINEALPTIRCEGSTTKTVDLQVSSGVNSINIYFSCAAPRYITGTEIIPKTTKLIGLSGVPITVYESLSVIGSQIPTNKFDTVKISDEQPAYTETLELIRPISTDNTKYCSDMCLNKGLGGKLIDDGPVVAAQEIEILSPFNVGVARSRITVITDSSILQGRQVVDEDGTIPSETIAFIRSLYPETEFPSTTYGRQFNKYKKLVSPERGSPSKYFGQASLTGLNVNFGNAGSVSLSSINQYESQYNPKYVTRPDIPWKDETDDKKIQEIKDHFINSFLNNQSSNAASTARFSGIVDGIMYSDATIAGGLPQLLKDKGYDYLDLDKLPSGYHGDLFGYSVCVRGEKILVGSPFSAFGSETITPWSTGLQLHLGNDGGAGSVYMFEKLSEDSWVCSKKFRPKSLMGQLSGINASSDQFGHSVALQNDTIVIGSPNHDYGNYYDVTFNDGAFARKNFNSQFDTPTYVVHDLGYSGIRSSFGTNGIYGKNTGAIYIYENKIVDWENKKQGWELVEKILPTQTIPMGSLSISERFGNNIALSRPYRSDADYTILAGCYSASGEGKLNIGVAYSKDIMLRKQTPSYANSGAWIDAKVFGDKGKENEYIVHLKFSNSGNNVSHIGKGIVVANDHGEIFIEVSGQDPSTKGFIAHRPYIESVVGQYQYGSVLENGMILFCNGQYPPPSSQMNLFIDVQNSAYVYNTLGLYGSVMTGAVYPNPSGLNLFIESPSGLSAPPLNLAMPSGIGSLQDNLNLQVRGK